MKRLWILLCLSSWAIAGAAWYLHVNIVQYGAAIRDTDDFRGPLWQRYIFNAEVQKMKHQ